jgi:BirA family transcriptional regulator, biotin operon repressor / biotin---[acetyl-CoA-carboxylase] ligase
LNKNRNAVLNLLQSNLNRYLSGTTIGVTLGISRSAVWKQINNLKKDGYRISARPHVGYRLDSKPDRLDETKLAGKKIIYRKVVDSTNLAVRQLAANSAPAWTTLVAEEQLAGRGRLGRSWFSPLGSGLWFSIILRPQSMSPAAANPLTLVTAAVIADYLKTAFNLEIQIKWPNDLLLNHKKMGGILTEIRGELDLIDYLVIGIGLNVNQKSADFPSELANQATSLMIESGTSFNRTELLLGAHQRLIRAYRNFETEGFGAFRHTWEKYNVTLGQTVTVSWAGGSITGVARELTPEGCLLVEKENGEIYTIGYGELV